VRRTRREAEEQRAVEAKAKELTFAKLAAEYIDASKRGFRAPRQQHRKTPRTIYREEKVLAKHAIPKLGQRPISEIPRREIVDLVEKVAHRNGVYAANGISAAIRRSFAYARYKDMVEHNPAIEISQYARPPRDVVASDDDASFSSNAQIELGQRERGRKRIDLRFDVLAIAQFLSRLAVRSVPGRAHQCWLFHAL
jgi:hypothetical protein